MREIKFRVWDIQNERIVYEPDRFELSYLDDEKQVSDFVFYETWRDREDGIRRNCHIMQFTGFHDKNGCEIYEGDVVESDHGVRYECVFLEGCFWLRSKEISYANAMRSWPDHCYPMFRVNHEIYSKVIGNIYENANLIE